MGKRKTSWDRFWDEFDIPFQEDDEDFDFANAVIVSHHFIKAGSVAKELGRLAEALTEQIANEKVQLERTQRTLDKFRTHLLSLRYDDIKTSARSEIQEAFIRKAAKELGKHRTLRRLERAVERHRRQVEMREPRVEQIRARMKLLENKLDWAKQYLDFDKLDIRVNQLERRGRM